MSSAIEWTDETWNPATGCDRVSPGCAHCYALDLAARLKAMGQPRYQRDGDPKTSGPGFGLTLHPDKLDEPLRWRKPRMVFVNSMSDLFHEEIPDQFIEEVFGTMAEAEQHTFQVLTKRPERARDLVPRIYDAWWPQERGPWDGVPLPNVWLGVSIENARYTWRADVLREIPAAVRFISAEPLLGSLFEDTRMRVDRRGTYTERFRQSLDLTGIDWLIVGGESGGRFARPMHPDWARELRDATFEAPSAALDLTDGTRVEWPGQCAFFFKQWGSHDENGVYRGASPKAGGRLLDGREWNEMPVREAVAA